jgi:hypothetical protein
MNSLKQIKIRGRSIFIAKIGRNISGGRAVFPAA